MELKKTGYFVLPASDQQGYNSTIISDYAFEIIEDKNQNIIGVKGKASLDKVNDPPIPILDDEGNPTGDIDAVFKPFITVQGKEVTTLKDGRKIVHAVIPQWVKEKVKLFLDPDVTDTDDPLDSRQAAYLGFQDKFIGYTRDDVFNAFPELIGVKVVGQDETGKDITVDKLIKHEWCRMG